MADPSADLGWFDPHDHWHSSPSILLDLMQWDLTEPSAESATEADTSLEPLDHGLSPSNAPWPAAEFEFDLAVHNATLPCAPPSAVSFVDPQDTIFNPENSISRPVPVLQDDNLGTSTRDSTLFSRASNRSRRTPRESLQDLRSEPKSPEQPKPKKQRRARLPREATSRFRAWFREHIGYPYPNPEEVLALAQDTQTTTKQVKAWFSNVRTRMSHDSSSSIVDKMVTPRHHGLTTSALETWSKASASPGSLDSVKRFLDIPEDDSESPFQPPRPDSLAAASATDHETASSQAEDLPSWLADSAGRQHSTAPSISGSDHHSVFSGMSHASMGSMFSRQTSFTSASASGGSRRRGKRRFDRLDSDASLSSKKFPCTFCAKAFSGAYDWKRHEATHLSFVAQWICMPDDTAIDEDGECLFCFAPGVDAAHTALHGVESCRQKPVEQRTFGRKDQLKQHIEICHLTRAQKADSHMLNKFLDQWHRAAELSWRNDDHKDALWCGFCCTHSHSWKERQDHVADHLRNRCSMDKWHSYRKFIAYCEEKWDEDLAATFTEYSQYVDHLIASLKAEPGENVVK